MNRESEAKLLEFCIRQRHDFAPAAWTVFDEVSREELVCAALFLAGVDWYGHEAALSAVADRLVPGSRGHLSGLMRRAQFDCGRFSNMLRRELDLCSRAILN